jgi:hypothetical protein
MVDQLAPFAGFAILLGWTVWLAVLSKEAWDDGSRWAVPLIVCFLVFGALTGFAGWGITPN